MIFCQQSYFKLLAYLFGIDGSAAVSYYSSTGDIFTNRLFSGILLFTV